MAIDFDRTFDRTYLRYLRTVRNSTLTRDEIADMCAIYMAFDRAARALDRVTVSNAELTRQVSALQEQHSVKQAIRDAAQAAGEPPKPTFKPRPGSGRMSKSRGAERPGADRLSYPSSYRPKKFDR